jgi:hypothetical protein
MTDGAGRYRLEDVPPGRYYLVAGSIARPGQRGMRAGSPCVLQAKYSGAIMQATYHAGVAELAMATPLTLAAGDSTLPDLRLPKGTGSGLTISGRITGTPVVNPGGRLVVRLGNGGTVPSQGPCPVLLGEVGPDGSFELRDVPPCNYAVDVMANYGDTGRGAFPNGGGSTNVNVVDKNITGLVLGR